MGGLNMSSVTADKIRKLFPKARPDLVQAIVDNWPAAEAAGINTPRRIQHFFAQIGAETGGLKSISESLNYAVKGLRGTFGKARITDADCERLGRSNAHPADQEAIANLVYGGTWGRDNLGNTRPGDGWLYRGSGYIQTTGRSNFKACGHEDTPDALRTPDAGFRAALVYWTDHRLNAVADAGNVKAVRKRVNPALKGLEEAEDFFRKAKTVFV
jgi:putative chitinase